MTRTGRTFVDVLAGACAVGLLAVLLVPAGLKAGGAADQCQANTQALTVALLAYATDHGQRMPGDDRVPQAGGDYLEDGLRNIPQDEGQYGQSWLAKLDTYAAIEERALDCPVVDDQRRGEWWPSDYVLNRWGVNTSVGVAAEPARAVLVGEPNMQRSTLLFLGEVLAWSEWGPRPDLEQNAAGSVSFGFADGHASRVAAAAGDNPHLAAYDELYMAQPGAEAYSQNYLWWASGQELPSGQ